MSGGLALVGDGVTATVSTIGAQLTSLVDDQGVEHLWDGQVSWPWHAPILFPQVCRATDDTVVVDGWRYPMPKHGFARAHEFEVVDRDPANVRLRWESTAFTRRHFPFAFRLDVVVAVRGGGVDVTFEVTNPGGTDLPFQLGWHPAFRWDPREPARVVTERAEPAAPWLTRDNLLAVQAPEAVLAEGVLDLDPTTTFASGGLVMRDARSRSVVLSAGGRHTEISWSGFDHLTLWSPPEGGFVCLEPWSGLPDPADGPAQDVTSGRTVLGPSQVWNARCSVWVGERSN